MDATLLAYMTATAALVLTPGATTAVVIRNAVDGGWRPGVATAAGAAIGNTTHAALTGFGLALLLHRRPAILLGVQIAGALYLAWLGISSLRRARTGGHHFAAGAAADATVSAAAGLREGLTVNLLNPSILTFYLVVVPTFLPVDPPASRFALLAAIHVAMAFVCHVGWSALFDRIRAAGRQTPIVRVLDVVAGIALLGLALRTLLRQS